jgi:protoporphyrinogen oxidase
MKRVVIIGGGLAGLGAAWELRRQNGAKSATVELYEKESRLGGLCRTETEGDFRFDYTGHALHFRTDFFRELVFGLIGDQLEQRTRHSLVFSKGVYTNYPFQANLHGLPREIVTACIYEYAKEHFRLEERPVNNFEDWIVSHFGQGIADHFMIPYNSKLYRRHPRELAPDCGGRFVPSSDLKLLIQGALTPGDGSLGYNANFYYPTMGGMETLIRGIARLAGGVRLNEAIVKIRSVERTVVTSHGKTIHYDALISTQPLPELVRSLEDAPPEVIAAASELAHVSVLNINFGVRGDLGSKHWVYVPEAEYVFYRFGFPHNFSPSMVPAGHSSIYIEVSYDPKETINQERIKERCIADLVRMGVLQDHKQIVSSKVLNIPYAYVIFDHARAKAVSTIKGYLDQMGIFTSGRFGCWDYYSMEDSFLSGTDAGVAVATALS